MKEQIKINLERISRIIDDFKARKGIDGVIELCKKQNSLIQVIEVAANCRDINGNKHNHQRRIKQQTLNELKERLIYNIEIIKNISDFENLHNLIKSFQISGCGELLTYDVAHRIGLYLNIQPDRVYLHRGTLAGAKKIINCSKKKWIFKDELPEPLKSSYLSCSDIEDLLCIFKKRI